MDRDVLGDDMVFSSADEFDMLKKHIKNKLEKKSKTYKCVYYWYIYSRPFVSDNAKHAIWDFLNGFCNEPEFKARLKNKRV